jgi:hypothetical protein
VSSNNLSNTSKRRGLSLSSGVMVIGGLLALALAVPASAADYRSTSANVRPSVAKECAEPVETVGNAGLERAAEVQAVNDEVLDEGRPGVRKHLRFYRKACPDAEQLAPAAE